MEIANLFLLFTIVASTALVILVAWIIARAFKRHNTTFEDALRASQRANRRRTQTVMLHSSDGRVRVVNAEIDRQFDQQFDVYTAQDMSHVRNIMHEYHTGHQPNIQSYRGGGNSGTTETFVPERVATTRNENRVDVLIRPNPTDEVTIKTPVEQPVPKKHDTSERFENIIE